MHYTDMVAAYVIQKARADLDESQQVFAQRFGVDQSTIHRWETQGVPERGMTARAVEAVLQTLPPAPTPEAEAVQG